MIFKVFHVEQKNMIMKKEVRVSCIEHKNVKGKALYYLLIMNGISEDYVINVGKGTFDAVNAMRLELESQLTIDDVLDKGLKAIGKVEGNPKMAHGD